MQSKRHSRIEVILNMMTGMVLAFSISQLAHWLSPTIREYIWKDFVWEITGQSNLVMTTVLTIVSYFRGMFWRRYFNRLAHKEHTR